MQLQANIPASVPVRVGSSPAATVAALVDAHLSERRLLEELIAIMRRQRDAVAADDLQGVDDSVFATHRILVTLGEARRRRRSLNTILGGADELDARALADAFGGTVPEALQEAREALRVAAGTLAGEVDVNRRILRDAMATGDEYMRRLVGAGAAGTPGQEPRGGSLLDRRV